MSETNLWRNLFFTVLSFGIILAIIGVNLPENNEPNLGGYSGEQLDGSISYYKWVAMENPDFRIGKLYMIDDVVLNQTRKPTSAEIKENHYIPQSQGE